MELLNRIVNKGYVFDMTGGITYNLELQGYLTRINPFGRESFCLYPTAKAIDLIEARNV